MLVSLPKQNKSNKQSLSLVKPINEEIVVGLTKANFAQSAAQTFNADTPSQTDHNNAEQSQNNDQRFSHLISIMPAGVVVVDKNGKVSLANQQAISLLGEPLIGKAWRDVISQVFTPKADDGHEVSMRNGKRVKIDISPLKQEKGQLICITDLTETRQLQTRMGHMQRLSSLGKMVASLAHQVRTPLSSALLYAENLKSMPLQNETATRFSEKLTLRLKELEAQVNDMLLFAKSSDKQIVASLSTSNIQQQSIAQVDAQLQQAGIDLLVSNDLPNADILGNATAIYGGISNLITNAMQAMAESNENSPKIEFTVTQTIKDKQAYAAFTIKDNGKGLTQSNVSSLFEPFFTTKSQGTGLGLAVVNTVAKSHKGFVKCGNNAAGGAFFALYLPITASKGQCSGKNSDSNSEQCSQAMSETNIEAHHTHQKRAGASYE